MAQVRLPKPPIGVPCNACGLCCQLVICSAGSFALGRVARYGQRAEGPCPALHHHDDGRQTCGLVERPKDWMPDHPKSVTALREAAMLLIGSGAGCDEAGDEPDATARPKLDAVVGRYLDRVTVARLQSAAMLLVQRRR